MTPPFPEYSRGHSTFSGAGATILANSFGGEAFGAYVGDPGELVGVRVEHPEPARDAVVADVHGRVQRGRRLAPLGRHPLLTGDTHGRALGRQVAQYVYSRAKSFINGTVPG